MSAGVYRGFLKVLADWPMESSKTGRDLGQYLRQCLSVEFRHGETSSVDVAHCQGQLDSLKRIVSDFHLQQNPRHGTSSATGMSREECEQSISNQTLQYYEQASKTPMNRLKLTLKWLFK